MAIKYAYTRPDGGVSIVHAAPKEHIERVLGPLTDEAYEAHVVERSIPADATNVTKLPDDWTPPDDRTFRDAWKHDKGKVVVDFEKAKKVAEKHGDVSKAKSVEELRAVVKAKA
jgi:hypothetical protein